MADTDTDVYFDLKDATKALQKIRQKKTRTARDEQRIWELNRDLHIAQVKKRELAERKRRGELTDPEDADELKAAFTGFAKFFGVAVSVEYVEGEKNRDGELICWVVRATHVRSDPALDAERWVKLVEKFNAEKRKDKNFRFADWRDVKIKSENVWEASWRIVPPLLG